MATHPFDKCVNDSFKLFTYVTCNSAHDMLGWYNY